MTSTSLRPRDRDRRRGRRPSFRRGQAVRLDRRATVLEASVAAIRDAIPGVPIVVVVATAESLERWRRRSSPSIEVDRRWAPPAGLGSNRQSIRRRRRGAEHRRGPRRRATVGSPGRCRQGDRLPWATPMPPSSLLESPTPSKRSMASGCGHRDPRSRSSADGPDPAGFAGLCSRGGMAAAGSGRGNGAMRRRCSRPMAARSAPCQAEHPNPKLTTVADLGAARGSSSVTSHECISYRPGNRCPRFRHRSATDPVWSGTARDPVSTATPTPMSRSTRSQMRSSARSAVAISASTFLRRIRSGGMFRSRVFVQRASTVVHRGRLSAGELRSDHHRRAPADRGAPSGVGEGARSDSRGRLGRGLGQGDDHRWARIRRSR